MNASTPDGTFKFLQTWMAPTALGTLLLAGCKPANQFVAPPPPEVTVAKPEIRTVTVYTSLPGRLQAKESIEIRARASGYLRSVDFADGQWVQAGAPLCVIEPEPYQAALDAAEANLAGAKASEGIAQTNYERREQAYQTRAISEIDLLKAKADLDAAKAAVLAAAAAVRQAQLDLSYTTNVAPATGRIGRKLVSEGNLVGGANPTLISTLIVEDPIYLYFNANERQLLRFLGKYDRREGAPQKRPAVKLRLADGSTYPLEGTIDFVDNRVDPETGTIEIRAVYPNPEGKLVPGLYGDVLIPDVRTNAVLVPDLAVLRDLGGSYVLTVGAGDKVESKYVDLGPKVETFRIIESGLEGQERVVVNGVQRARPGLQVTPRTAETSRQIPTQAAEEAK